MIGRHDGPHAGGKRPEQARKASVELFQGTDPAVGADSRSVARVIDIRPVQVDNGRAGAQLTQRGAHAVVERLCRHMTRTTQCRPRQAGASETRR